MKNKQNKNVFLENLKKIPIIQAACERSTVSRASIYRWKNEDKEFAKALDEAMNEGEALINDLSEGQLITLIKDKNFSAIRFWLNHRHVKFRERIDINTNIQTVSENLTPEQEASVQEALRLASSEIESINKGGYEEKTS